MAINDWLFVPVKDDKAPLFGLGVKTFFTSLAPTKFKVTQASQVKIVEPGNGSLAELTSTDPARLYIYGHGNMGAGIGTHDKHYNATDLVKLLQTAGLEANQTNLTIYLWACNTGVDMSRFILKDRESYCQRMARHLAKASFTNTYVVGFVGFLNGCGDAMVLRTNIRSGKIVETEGKQIPMKASGESTTSTPVAGRPAPPFADHRHLVWDVTNGEATMVSGRKWSSECKTPEFKVYKGDILPTMELYCDIIKAT